MISKRMVKKIAAFSICEQSGDIEKGERFNGVCFADCEYQTAPERLPAVQYKKKRVAAYARVSSGKDAMLHSLSSQISYYSSLIQRNAEWEYAGVYADEAITGTKDRRPEFQRLLADCRNGKIDIILTKSISRFARNTVTTLQIVRELRDYGVDVHFERENLKSLDPDGEFILTILASFAQEESLTASENQKWKIRKNFSEGVTTTTSILGYRIDHGEITVIPEEAAIVRRIFDCYLSGMGLNAIARMLQKDGVPTKHGGRWADKTVRQILSNEKYKGTLLLQKTFSLDHISKKKAVNKGALPQYLVENSHDAIVSPDTSDAVQRVIESKSNTANSRSE